MGAVENASARFPRTCGRALGVHGSGSVHRPQQRATLAGPHRELAHIHVAVRHEHAVCVPHATDLFASQGLADKEPPPLIVNRAAGIDSVHVAARGILPPARVRGIGPPAAAIVQAGRFLP